MQGTIQQAYAAKALMSQQWVYNSISKHWFHLSPEANSQVGSHL